jgi:CelD/BcsL family acetyltransferase involved in cellulose biosynthesis
VYGGLIGEFTDKVLSILLQELLQTLAKGEADVVLFNHLRTDSPVHQLVRTKLNVLCRSHFQNFQNHWQTLIPSPSEGLDRVISKKHQRDIQRCVRNLEKTCSGPVRFVCYRKKEDIQEFMDTACRISASTYQGRMGMGFVADSLTRSLLSQAQEDGWLRAYVLYAGTEPVAFEYGCVQGDGYFAEQAGYDLRWNAYSPGTILQLKIFEHLGRDDNVVKYDYGLGDATYKQRFGSVSWPEVSLYIFAPRLHPIIINLLTSLIRGMSIGMARLVQKLGFTGKIKRWWRGRLSAGATEHPQ